MSVVIPVRFAYAARDLWFDVGATGAQEGDHVICSTERGTEIGLATADAREVSRAELTHKVGHAVLKPVLRVASDEDLDRAELQAQRGDDALPTFRRLVLEGGLDMKPVGVEYIFGGEKVVCYFVAEERVDFRQLVRDLSRELHERIDMRQIGVREEAAFVGGFGHCGQELCCSRFGLSFEPVSIRMAKEQDLPLTSNKISGACGRLMCCLRYEFEAYRDFKGRAPKRNAVIDTPLGKAKVVEYDTPKEQLALRIENGKVVRIPLAEMVASDAAVKKSEELHCPCRPDTVLRSSLERLSSPDVQMALAELDRKMGVIPVDTFDDSDLFVDAQPSRRRRRRKGQAAANEADVAPSKTGEQAGSRRTRRRRPGSGAASAASAQQAGEPSQPSEQPAEKRSRRRRRKRSGAASAEGAATAPQERTEPKEQKGKGQQQPSSPSPSRRRRHHKSSSGDASSPKAEQQAQQPRRRPGDRAGQQAQAGQQPQASQQTPTGEGTGGAKRRRRRRRRGGGNKPAGEQPKSE